MATKQKRAPVTPDLPRGITDRSMRLTYPGKWRNQKAAQLFARDNHLDASGAVAVDVDGVWHIVIDTHRAAMIMPWLRQQFAVAWQVGWTPPATQSKSL